MEKQKGKKHPLLCYFASYFSCRIEKKKLKKLEIKIAVYTSPSKDRMPIGMPFVLFSEAWKQFSSLKTYLHCTSFQFTMYNSSVILFSLHYSRLKNNLHPRDSRSAKLQSHQRRNPNYLKRILKARKLNNEFCRKLALAFRKHHHVVNVTTLR